MIRTFLFLTNDGTVQTVGIGSSSLLAEDSISDGKSIVFKNHKAALQRGTSQVTCPVKVLTKSDEGPKKIGGITEVIGPALP